MNVTKRNGTKQPWDIQKIRKQIEYAYRDTGLNPLELESKVSLSLKPNINTNEIQELLVQTAITMISIDQPEMALVAGRLAMHQLHRHVYKNTKIEWNELDKYLTYAIKHNWYRDDFAHIYSKEDIEVLSGMLNLDYDYAMVIAQVLSLKSKYLVKSKKGIVEYPQFSDMTSSMILASIEKDPMKWAGEYFNLLSSQIISLATPFKMNLRRPNGNTGSCFILPVADNLLSISKSWVDMAIISKNGGGIGVYLGYLRPEDSWSPSITKSNNVTRWTKIINDIAVAVNQKGVRPGAITPAVDWWHLDVFDFIEMKTETESDLRAKCFDLFPQVIVDKYFIQAKEADEEVYLFDHYEYKQLTGIVINELVDEALFEAHIQIKSLIESGKLKHFKKIRAKALWSKLLKVWFETGDFYIAHKDNINLGNYLKAEYVANSVNLCTESWSITKIATEWKQEVKDEEIIVSESNGLTHSCSLISINVGVIFTDELLKRACYAAVRALDTSIDLGKMPVVEAMNSSEALRNIGIGTLGVADWMAWNKLSYEKPEDLKKLEALQEKIAWYCYHASMELSIEKGAYPLFHKADYSKMFGKPIARLNELSPNGFDWVEFSEEIRVNGMRNFLLLATAPNSSTAILMGATASYQPPQSKFSYQTLADMAVPILPRYIKDRNWWYKSKFNYPAHDMIAVTRILQRWIDTGISMEVFINPEITNIKLISDAITLGFIEEELKAVYYQISIDAKAKDACVDCAN
jgi:ribonucleoside-diphosphate reductase alpha chain